MQILGCDVTADPLKQAITNSLPSTFEQGHSFDELGLEMEAALIEGSYHIASLGQFWEALKVEFHSIICKNDASYEDERQKKERSDR